jgi:hypothetical protein
MDSILVPRAKILEAKAPVKGACSSTAQSISTGDTTRLAISFNGAKTDPMPSRRLPSCARALFVSQSRVNALSIQAATYRWSSHGAYLGKDNLVWVDTAPVPEEFAKSLGNARLVRLRFMAECES